MKTQKRTLTPQFKMQVALEALKENQSQVELAREYDLHPHMITDWKRQLLSAGAKVFEDKRGKKDAGASKKIENLEKIIGRQTIEIQFLKKVLGHLG
jgi:transposase